MQPLSRSRYIRTGLWLMAVKYVGDVALVLVGLGRFWTPLDYIQSLALSQSLTLNAAPTWLLLAMGVWLLPFFFAGIWLTMRRAVDTGWSPWIALLFFVPIGNYVVIAALSMAPSRVVVIEPLTAARSGVRGWPPLVTAGAAAAAAGVITALICVGAGRSYGAALFLGTPLLIGLVSGYVLRRLDPESTLLEGLFAGLIGVVIAVAVAVTAGIEGAGCLLMALPITMAVASFGVFTGAELANRVARGPWTTTIGVVALPLAGLLGSHAMPPPVAREVFTSIEIAAPPDRVWPHVIAFAPIPEPTDLLARAGVAYPIRARIDGTGVGATRYCEFSTGAFVEPITAWELDRRLAFDVTVSPPPMRELSLWKIHPPHLDGYLRSRHGEFRLVPLPGGRTRLEGRTWYEIDMAPEWYWRLWADWMIHWIHDRVLEHIKLETEAR